MKSIGNAIPRVEGSLKTTGVADYAADRHFPGMLFGAIVGSTVAKGRITKLDTSDAKKMPGVFEILHRENIGKLYRVDPSATFFDAYLDERRPPFEDDEIRYHGQYIALVLAETFEQAQAAARAVKVTYTVEKPDLRTELELTEVKPAPGEEGRPNVDQKNNQPGNIVNERGDVRKVFEAAAVKIDQVYITPSETHCAIELHATIAVPNGDSITLYETSQGVVNHRNVVVQQLGVAPEKVRVISKFLGSGFGGKLFPWTYSVLTAAAARAVKRPVKLVLDRATVFETVGHRPPTKQRIRLGATADGRLTSLQQDYVNHTAIADDYEENCGEATPYFYSCPNLKITKGLAKRNIGNATSMRGPGAVPGLFATETALDELAVALKMDPVQLRVINEPKTDESLNIPFSTRHLLECFSLGAEKFGWNKRDPKVGSMKRGELTLGWGMAGASWMAERFAAEVTVELLDDGTVRVVCGTQDIGTGTYTMLVQIAAERLGLPAERIKAVLGDSSLPPGPLNGGSMATASIIPATYEAADAAIKKLVTIAATSGKLPFSGKKAEELAYSEGFVHLKGQTPKSGVPFEKILQSSNVRSAPGNARSEATLGKKAEVSRHSYGAHFVEVTWEASTARLRVSRVVTIIDAGKIINPKTARNQIEGAAVMGIGMGIFEETLYDHRNGLTVNRNLADYVVPVNADVPRIDVHFLDYPDTTLNEIGARGVGEIGLAGIAAALSNAVYHATGVRVRDLPISIEDLLAGGA